MVPENDAEPVIADASEEVTVDDSPEPGAGGGEPAARADETEEQRQSRKEFRKSRMKAEKEARERAESEARQTREALDRVQRELAETRGYVSALSQQRNAGDPEAVRKSKIDQLEAEAERHLQNAGVAAAMKTAEGAERARAEMRAYNAKQREIARVEDEPNRNAELDRRLGEFRRQQPMAMTPQIIQAREALVAKYPWINPNSPSFNQRALDATDQEVERRMRAGQAFTPQMAMAVAAEVQRDLRLAVNTPPSDRQRAAYQAPGGGEAAGGGEDGGAVTVKMGKAEKIMAHKLYPGMDPKEAEKKWAREVGAPDARRRARAGR